MVRGEGWLGDRRNFMNDYCGHASTYHQLGLVARKETVFPEALRCLVLEIFLHYKDECIAIENLDRLVSAWEPPGNTIAGLECSEEVKEG